MRSNPLSLSACNLENLRQCSFIAMHLRLLVVRNAHLVNQLELDFQPVDMLLLGFEDAAKEIAAHVVAAGFAVGNGSFQDRMRGKLELEVTLECFLDVLPNQELVQILQVWQSFKEEDALDQAVSVLHLVARCLALVPAKATESPVIEHLGMHEILVDCGELVGQDLGEALDHLGIALHLVPPWIDGATSPAAPVIFVTVSSSSDLAQQTQRPHPSPTPRPWARSSAERVPSSAAWTICRSVIALQMQMYMRRRYHCANGNANHSYSRILIWLKDWSWELGYEAALLPRGAAPLGRKKAKTDGVVATKALTRKLARACCQMIKEQKPFDVKCQAVGNHRTVSKTFGQQPIKYLPGLAIDAGSCQHRPIAKRIQRKRARPAYCRGDDGREIDT